MDIFRAATETANRLNLQSITHAIINELAPPIEQPTKKPSPQSSNENVGNNGTSSKVNTEKSPEKEEWMALGFAQPTVPTPKELPLELESGNVPEPFVLAEAEKSKEEITTTLTSIQPEIQRVSVSPIPNQNDSSVLKQTVFDIPSTELVIKPAPDTDQLQRLEETVQTYDIAMNKLRSDLEKAHLENEQLKRN